MNIRSITLFWNAEERCPLNMCHLCIINDVNTNECISLTQNTLTFKIGFRAFLQGWFLRVCSNWRTLEILAGSADHFWRI